MNKNPSAKDPIRIIITITVVAFLIAALAAVLFFMTGEKGVVQQSALNSEIKRIEAENTQAQQAYDEAVAEAARQEEAAQATTAQAKAQESQGNLSSWTATLGGAEWTVADLGTAALENVRTETYERQDLLYGGMLLVNPWHSLPEDFSDENLLVVGTTGDYKIQVDSAAVKLFQPAFDALVEALKAAEAEGITHYIVREGYRSVEEQTELFNARMEKLSGRYSGEELIAKTKQEVNYPGTSDYHTGMTFRMDVYERGNSELNNQKFQSESTQGAWLTENCWKYGIIFRFPTSNFPNSSWEDKSYKTGVSAQLNMYRYVGKAHSAAMRIMGLCLEEYIEFLIDHPHISISENGVLKYEVIRIGSVGDRSSVSVPVFNMAADVQAGLDNMDGVVLAFSY